MLRKTLALVIIVLLAGMVIGCNGDDGNGDGATAPIKLVPRGSDMLMSMDVGAFIEAEDIAQLAETMGEDPETRQAADVVEAILSDVDEVMLFGVISELDEDEPYMGIIVTGSFTESELIALVEEESAEAPVTYTYGGITVYTDDERETGVAFPGNGQAVLAPIPVIEDVIDVRQGSMAAVSGTVLTTYNGLGSGDMRMAIAVPPDVMAEALEGSGEQVPLDLSAFEDLTTVGVAADDRGEYTAIDLQMCFSSAASAQEVEGMISGLLPMVGMMPDVPPETVELLDTLEITVNGSCVGISLEITEEQAESLMEGLGSVELPGLSS